MSGRQDWEAYVREMMIKFGLTDLNSIDERLKAFMLFYHFYDGQKARIPHVDSGLFGTYVCYAQFVSLFMLPSNYVKVQSICGLSLAVFSVCPRSGKFMSLVVGCPEELKGRLLYRVIEIDEKNAAYIDHGTFLEWFERYIDALEAGAYDVSENERSISMFPNIGDNTSICVTRGIEVSASSIASLESGTNTGAWVYKIKMKYVGGFDAPRRVRLARRHWHIRYKSGNEEHVRGEGVVGQNPVLGMESTTQTHSYCSICTGRSVPEDPEAQFAYLDPPVSMEGEFEFETMEPEPSQTIQVRIAPFTFIEPKPINGENFPIQQLPNFDWVIE
jgi:uncharacterized protein affecting Mg2+/Co2+ transport